MSTRDSSGLSLSLPPGSGPVQHPVACAAHDLRSEACGAAGEQATRGAIHRVQKSTLTPPEARKPATKVLASGRLGRGPEASVEDTVSYMAERRAHSPPHALPGEALASLSRTPYTVALGTEFIPEFWRDTIVQTTAEPQWQSDSPMTWCVFVVEVWIHLQRG